MNEDYFDEIAFLKSEGYRTLYDWALSLGQPYSDYLFETFGYNEIWESKSMYSPYEILDAIIQFEGGIASARKVLNLVNLIYGTNLR